MGLSSTQKKVAGVLGVIFLAWQFWIDPLGLAAGFNAFFAILGQLWDKFTIFMGALGGQ